MTLLEQLTDWLFSSSLDSRYYLLAADKAWHGKCLRCCRCSQTLDTELSCFCRGGNIYCKDCRWIFSHTLLFRVLLLSSRNVSTGIQVSVATVDQSKFTCNTTGSLILLGPEYCAPFILLSLLLESREHPRNVIWSLKFSTSFTHWRTRTMTRSVNGNTLQTVSQRSQNTEQEWLRNPLTHDLS